MKLVRLVPVTLHHSVTSLSDLFAQYSGLYFKGGTARSHLMSRVLGFDLEEPRDLDCVLIGGTPDEQRSISVIAKSLGIDIEYAESMDQYLSSRDFTINEVALRPDVMVCTRAAISHIWEKRIVPSQSEYKWWFYEPLSYRIALRATLFAVRYGFEADTDAWSIAYNAIKRASFMTLVTMDKASSTGHLETWAQLLGIERPRSMLLQLLQKHPDCRYSCAYAEQLLRQHVWTVQDELDHVMANTTKWKGHLVVTRTLQAAYKKQPGLTSVQKEINHG